MVRPQNQVGYAGTPQERLERRLVHQTNGCLEWQPPVDKDGYGHICVYGKVVGVHRLAWELAYGPISGGLHVLHHCDNPPCCEPTHLFLGTQADNNADRNMKGRNGMTAKTHCPKRHEYNESNTRINAVGARECRECRNEHSRAYYYSNRIG